MDISVLGRFSEWQDASVSASSSESAVSMNTAGFPGGLFSIRYFSESISAFVECLLEGTQVGIGSIVTEDGEVDILPALEEGGSRKLYLNGWFLGGFLVLGICF